MNVLGEQLYRLHHTIQNFIFHGFVLHFPASPPAFREPLQTHLYLPVSAVQPLLLPHVHMYAENSTPVLGAPHHPPTLSELPAVRPAAG